MSSKKKLRNIRLSAPICTAAASLIGFGVIFLMVLLIAFIITKLDVADNVISFMTSAALCTGAYVGGFISAKRRRKNGLLMGILCGVFIFFVIFVLSLLFAKTAGGMNGSSKLVLTLIFGAIGGVVGVNSKNNKFYR